MTAVLGDGPILDEDFTDETDVERQAREDTDVVLDDMSKATVDAIVEKMLLVVDEVSGHPLYGYQRPFAARLIESLIINDGATLTALFSRQCLDGDTVVFREDGTAVRLRDFEHRVATGVKPTKRYRMRGGAEVTMTDNHPVLTPDGWIAAGFLRPGDTVSVAQGVYTWPGVEKIDREIPIGRHKTLHRVIEAVDTGLARFLGYFVTDGSMRPGQSMKFTNTRPEYLAEVENLVQDRWGITPKRYAKGNGFDLLFTTTKSSYGNPLADAMHSLQWDHGFPVDVFSWDPETVSEFVNRAWSGDGCISMKKSGPDIFLATGNDEIYARYWQALLLKFGVMSTIKREQHVGGTGTFYRLVIGNGARNVKRFFQSFGPIFGKEDQSWKAIDYFAQKASRPSGKGRSERVMFKEHGAGPHGEELVWAKVLQIEDAGDREVFDPHVEGKGWLIAQGLQVSNSGKSETVANTVAAVMIMFPVLAKVFPDLLGKYSEGVWVGAFAPVEDQADNLYGRIVARISSERAIEIMSDSEIDDGVDGSARTLRLKRSGSLVRKQTCHPRATIEGRTYHLILIDECQGADEKMVNKGIGPMGASTNATMVFTGTPTYDKGVFYKTIQLNKRQAASRRGHRVNHFEADWKEVSKWNANYARFVKKELLRIGEDADEFKLSYRLMWLLDRGMFVTAQRLDELGDLSMQVVHAWHKSPVVIGIDPARKMDSTIVTVVWVDWANPDEFGNYAHRVLNWLDLSGLDWEEQYFRIVEFVSNYSVMAIAIDSGGVGDVVASRLKRLLPNIPIEEMGSQRPDQSKRWKHLSELMDRSKIGWPMHAHTRRLKTYKRFRLQMEDLEKHFEGPYVLAAAPREADAHDDYADSLALACMLTKDYQMPEVEQSGNIFY